MANTGITWGAWTAVTKSGTGDWSALDVTDNGNAGSAEIAFGTAAAIKIGFSLTEAVGAVDGDVTIYVLNETADGDWQVYGAVDEPYQFALRPVASETFRDWFALYAGSWGDSIKIWMLNESGRTLATTFKYQLGTVPVAS